jgi:hypothetical protein
VNDFFIKVRKKGQIEMDKNLMPRKVYVKILYPFPFGLFTHFYEKSVQIFKALN